MQNLPLAWSVARRDPPPPLHIASQSRLCDILPSSPPLPTSGLLRPDFFCHPEGANSLTMAPIAQAVTVSLEDLKKGT